MYCAYVTSNACDLNIPTKAKSLIPYMRLSRDRAEITSMSINGCRKPLDLQLKLFFLEFLGFEILFVNFYYFKIKIHKEFKLQQQYTFL